MPAEEERWRPQVEPCLARAVQRAPVLAAMAVHWPPEPRAAVTPEEPACAWCRWRRDCLRGVVDPGLNDDG